MRKVDLQRPVLLVIILAACTGYVVAGAAPDAGAPGDPGTMRQAKQDGLHGDELVGPAGNAADEAALRQEMREVIERHKRELLPEYERRVREDGQKSADEWLRTRAREIGRKEGERVRGKYGGRKSR